MSCWERSSSSSSPETILRVNGIYLLNSDGFFHSRFHLIRNNPDSDSSAIWTIVQIWFLMAPKTQDGDFL